MQYKRHKALDKYVPGKKGLRTGGEVIAYGASSIASAWIAFARTCFT